MQGDTLKPGTVHPTAAAVECLDLTENLRAWISAQAVYNGEDQ